MRPIDNASICLIVLSTRPLTGDAQPILVCPRVIGSITYNSRPMPTFLEVFVTIKVLGERGGVALLLMLLSLLTSDKANKKPKQIYHDIS